MQFAIGVDGGGTGCRVAIADRAGNVLGRGSGGPANIATNLEEAARNIVKSITAAARDITAESTIYYHSTAVLGLAGANVGDHAERLKERLGFARCEIVSDAQTSLNGALAGMDGTGAMIGTGSVFASRIRGRFRQLGGWGFQLGDQAGGAWIGRNALEAALLSYDGIKAGSDLTETLLKHFGGAAQITEFGRKASPSEYAALAPMVLAAASEGDMMGLEIFGNASDYIAKAIETVSYDKKLPITLIGGLSTGFGPFLPESLKARLVPAKGNALDGALRMAVGLLNRGTVAA
jgi:glucosamine kinase